MQLRAAEGRPSPPSTRLPAALDRAWQLAREGLVRQSLAALEALHTSGAIDPGSADAAVLLATRSDCRLARGELDEALGLSHELAPYLQLPGTTGAVAHHAHGELAAALGEPERAATHFAAAGDLVAGTSDDPDLVPWRAGAALAAIRTGERRSAVRLAQEQVDRAAGSSFATAHALRVLAAADPCGDHVALLRQARQVLEGVCARRLAAQIDTDLAGSLVLADRTGNSTEAIALLRPAEEYAGRQGLWPLQQRIRRLLARLGEQPCRVESEALAALTTCEHRVALLAASGLTNRQVATELEVSVKAVEWHLSHVYRKLGIRSRRRLADSFGEPV